MASVDDLLAECADGDGWAAAAQSVHVAPAPVPTAAPALPFAHCSPPTAPTLLQFNHIVDLVAVLSSSALLVSGVFRRVVVDGESFMDALFAAAGQG